MSTIPYCETDTGTWEKCPVCHKTNVYHSFMVSDGFDDVTWDQDFFTCSLCGYNPCTQTIDTPYGEVTVTKFGGSQIL